MFPKFPMCSKAFFSLFSLPRTKNPNSPSSKLAQTVAATRRNNSKFKTKPVSGSRRNQCRMFGCFFCCFCDVEFLGLSFGFFIFFLERFSNLELQFFPLVFELPFRYKNKQEEKKWKQPSLHFSSSRMR